MAPKRKRTPSSSSETEMDPETERASSSGTTTFQVFLSFRGPDTRRGFTDTLYHSLTDAGIRVFRDNEEIRKGEYIGDEILTAISESRIFVPIFSRGYASSKWCLIELTKMFESMEASPGSNKKILPIFYDVGVDDVKLKTELYAEALSEHREKYSQNEVQQWEEALREAGKIKGWEVKDMGHGEFAKFFVREVSMKLKVKHKFITDYLVQRDEQVEELMGLLDTGASDVRFVGIHGMGGIGKTTLVKNVYNKLCNRFEHCSFLTDVRESCQRKGIEHLQKTLLGDLGFTFGDIMHVEDGIMKMREMLPHKKVLIVLDDVDDRNQIRSLALAADARRFCQGSRIVITTRNQQVLRGGIQKMEVEPMKPDEALRLFSMHAFDNNSPPIEHRSLSEDAVKSTGRLPLALEVIGSHLRDMPHKKWAKKIERLKKIPHEDVQEKLMISYESLRDGAKKIFLDIACFFIGRERRNPMYMWEACDSNAKMGLKELIHKSLVKIDGNQTADWTTVIKDKEFRMHDQLRDLGRTIAKGSRIWVDKDASKVLRETEGKVNMEMFRCYADYNAYALAEIDTFSREEFSGIDQLRYLECVGVNISGDLRGLLPNLRWLNWRFCPVEFTDSGLSFRKLVILDLSWSEITEDWTAWSKIGEANNLKVLDLTGCDELRRTPDLSNYSSLERLILEECCNLVEIDRSIGRLKGLKFLNVDHCTSLEGLPDELYSLDHLEVILGGLAPYDYPTCLPEFNIPASIGNLTSLLSLHFHLFKTTIFPESIIRLSGLRHLSLTGIVELPQSVGLLEKLEILELAYCDKMEKLPNSIGDMKSLVQLNLLSSGITELPETIGKLKGLEKLIATSCHSLTEIPSAIHGCTSLRILNLAYCESMKELPDSIGCAGWRELDLTSHENIKELPVSECFLRSLCELRLSWSGITKLPDTIGSLKDLSILSLDGTKIRSLPASIGMLKNLEELDVRYCDLLEEIPSTIEGCTRLRKLYLACCKNIKEIPVSERFLTSCELRLPDHLYFDSAGVIRPRSKLKLFGVEIDISPNIPSDPER